MADITISQDELDAKIAAAVDEATSGLVSKNKELLGKLSKAKTGDIDPAEVTRLESEVDRLTNELAKTSKEYKAAAKQAEDLSKKLADSDGFTQKLLIDNGLNEALGKANVAEPLREAARALFASQVKVDPETRKVMMGDKDALTAITEWASSDQGKYFVAAPAHGGAGAPGSGNVQGGKTVTRAQYEADPAGAGRVLAEGGKLVD